LFAKLELIASNLRQSLSYAEYSILTAPPQAVALLAVKLEFMIQGIEASRSLERAATLQHFFDPKKINV
jgi:hypothetical protein